MIVTEIVTLSHYSPKLKRIIVLVFTHEVISTKSDGTVKSLNCFLT